MDPARSRKEEKLKLRRESIQRERESKLHETVLESQITDVFLLSETSLRHKYSPFLKPHVLTLSVLNAIKIKPSESKV
jgi:hypothetical protein